MDARLYPATKSMAVTPHDTNRLSDGGKLVRCRGVSMTVAGSIVYKDENGTTRTANGLAAGIIHPISTDQILTASTATGIYVYW